MGDSYSYSDTGAVLAILLILLPILLLFALAGYLISSFFLMRIFDKAGVQGRWRAWVPFYNLLVLAKLGDVSPWVVLGGLVASALLGQIPVIGWIIGLVPVALAIMYSWRVGLKLGKEWYWLLLFLIPGVGPLIWLGILAFDSSRWNTAIAPSPWANSFLADTTVWSGVPTQPGQRGPSGPSAGATPPPPARPQV